MASSFFSTRSAGLAAMLGMGAAFAQIPQFARQQKIVPKIEFRSDAPVKILSADWGDSKVTPRGGAMFVDVRAGLSLRNDSQRKIRGITLAVLSQEAMPGGKGSVSVPSLDIAPEQTFPVNIDLHLISGQGGPAVEVRLDGVLFDDLTFYGPDMLHSRRTMTVWELEARRDRQYFKGMLETAGGKGLQDAIIDSVARQSEADPPAGGVQVVRGRATNSDPEREVSFAFLHFPGAPVEASGGMVKISGNEARTPRVDVKSRSAREIRYLEIGWIVKDREGHELLAASMPSDVSLAPGKAGQVGDDASLRFTRNIAVDSMTGFVSSVGFSDGSYWIPDRAVMKDPKFKRAVAPSPEEQRLVRLYMKRGLPGLIEELKKF